MIIEYTSQLVIVVSLLLVRKAFTARYFSVEFADKERPMFVDFSIKTFITPAVVSEARASVSVFLSPQPRTRRVRVLEAHRAEQ